MKKIYMLYNWKNIDNIFIKNNNTNFSETIGFHWFNGSDITKIFERNL